MSYLPTFVWAVVLFGLIVLWSAIEFFIESRKKEKLGL